MSQTATGAPQHLTDDDVQAIDRLRDAYGRLKSELGKVIIGQHDVIDQLVICLFAKRHALLMGVPGLAKTLLVSKLAETLSLKFSRIQFTPDLMPMDITGTDILQENAEGRREFQFVQGPVFANIVLADEINRAPPKTQAAMLEAMQEQRVTILGKTFTLPPPFMVLATQNPVEQEGTYPLPEAQVDRFMLKLYVDYPSKAEELEVMRRMADTGFDGHVNQVLDKAEITAIGKLINAVNISESLELYIIELIFATRKPADYGMKDAVSYIQYGASPRATINLARAAKAMAFFAGRDYVLPEDIKEIAPDVLNHRIILTYEAEADGIRPRQIVDRILATVAIAR